MANSETQETENVVYEANKVSIKIPPFWSEKPEIWFLQVEAQFSINRITSEETKFNYLISQLEPKYIENIWDIISDKGITKYTAAKSRLLDIFKESEDVKIKRLLTGVELGDYKPSQLLRKMQSLAGKDISDKVIRTLWLNKLPDSVKNILIVSEECLERVAVMADKMLEMNPNKSVFAVDGQDSKCATINELVAKIAQLEQQIATMSVSQYRGRSRSPYRRNQSRNRSRSRRRYDPKGKYCYYHFRFGQQCLPEKCKQPCSWKSSENSNGQ